MKRPRNFANGTVALAQGRQLPAEWRQQAAARAALADADYAHTIENAWRRPLTHGVDRLRELGTVNLTQAAKLDNPAWGDLLGEK